MLVERDHYRVRQEHLGASLFVLSKGHAVRLHAVELGRQLEGLVVLGVRYWKER